MLKKSNTIKFDENKTQQKRNVLLKHQRSITIDDNNNKVDEDNLVESEINQINNNIID